jgi:ubiquinone/menaquinone biosynthesis C-methylase UbiE
MSIANTAQSEHWNTGDGISHWIANHARYDRMHAPFTALILDATGPQPDDRLLDVGCGCGGTTLAAARLIAPGPAMGLDLSGPMLAQARPMPTRPGWPTWCSSRATRRCMNSNRPGSIPSSPVSG